MDVLRSWQRFKAGLLLFAPGALLLLSAGDLHIAFYVVSLMLLTVGFVLAMWGYAGIFISRFSGLKPPSGKKR
ncbi:hypothetical protein [Alteromonas sp. CYL-A6]|uniref:hypothetical protein n=1 Tax=Alteromonas nitratireducens TaxID=3390813 RepID=UPI0034C178F4